jgi:hypothetical protein
VVGACAHAEAQPRARRPVTEMMIRPNAMTYPRTVLDKGPFARCVVCGIDLDQ